MIFVCVGSRNYQFNRLFVKLDELCEEGVIKEDVFAQIGVSTYKPKHFKYKDFKATKKSNELMVHTYSHLYGIPSTGLRFFTVYGPMGRPDMAYFGFTQKIFKNEPIKIFNYGECYRDFTYIDDSVEAMVRILCNPPVKKEDKNGILDGIQYAVYNIGNSKPEQLMDYIAALEKALSKAVGREVVAKKEFLPIQPGDVKATYSDSTPLERNFEFKPSTGIEEGLQHFADWYVDYYQVK